MKQTIWPCLKKWYPQNPQDHHGHVLTKIANIGGKSPISSPLPRGILAVFSSARDQPTSTLATSQRSTSQVELVGLGRLWLGLFLSMLDLGPRRLEVWLLLAILIAWSSIQGIEESNVWSMWRSILSHLFYLLKLSIIRSKGHMELSQVMYPQIFQSSWMTTLAWKTLIGFQRGSPMARSLQFLHCPGGQGDHMRLCRFSSMLQLSWCTSETWEPVAYL